MEQNRPPKVLVLPEGKIAIRKILTNAFFYALGVVFVVVALLMLVYPKFFFVLFLRHYDKFFMPQAMAFYFFFKMLGALLLMGLLSFLSYFILNWVAIRQKEIYIILSSEGVESHWGKMKKNVSWDFFNGISLTTNPFLIKGGKRGKLRVFDVFEQRKLQKRIEEYRKSL